MIWGGGDVPRAAVDQFLKQSKTTTIAVLADGMRSSNIRALLEDRAKGDDLSIVSIAPEPAAIASQIASSKAIWIDAKALPAGASPLDQVLLDRGFCEEKPPAALADQLAAHSGLIGVGIADGAGLIARGRRLEAVGAARVSLVLPASTSRPQARPISIQTLRKGDDADLIAASRAAIARLGPAFPPDVLPAPEVASGSLLICGGGDLPDEIWQRFIDLAGGKDAPIVVFPTAKPPADDAAPKGLDRLQKLGCTHLAILNQRTKEEVASPKFAEALKQARGVWFVGGRQWRYVDAYEGTVAEELFHDVLKRGGVIGGSSAGAAIQAQYLVRGDPLENKKITAEGYERGLNFLPGTAIDIHVSQRERLSDLSGLIHTFPQLLGLALDEDTAIEVKGHVLSVLGAGELSIISGKADPIVLRSRGRYDLAARETPR